MAEIYDEHYALDALLRKESRVIPRPVLYDLSPERLLDEALNRLAQDNTYFTSRNPVSGHGIFLQVLFYYLDLLGYEFNLITDLTWIRLYDMLGVTLSGAKYAIFEVEFTKIAEYPRDVFVPLATEVFSTVDPGVSLLTTEDLRLWGGITTGTVRARLNQLGKLGRTPDPNEFTYIKPIAGIARVRHTQVLFPGRDRETLSDGMLRARQQMRTMGRAVTARDYFQIAKTLGAQKVGIFREVDLRQTGGRHGDALSISVYPAAMRQIVDAEFRKEDYRTVGQRTIVVGAEIFAMGGTITINAVTGMANRHALAWSAVEKINPPKGQWGDRELHKRIATEIEKIQGFYAVPEINLYRISDQIPYDEIEIRPWYLFSLDEIQFIFQ